MIQFFRKIRQNLLSKGKTGRYFKYAIGEIVLVVIGILIALQINTWNEGRKARAYEVKAVKGLIADTKADSIFYQSRVQLFSNQMESYRSLFEFCNSSNPIPQDSIQFNGSQVPFTLAANYSDVIHNHNEVMEVISSDSIKQILRDYYKSFEFVSKAIELSNADVREYGNVFHSRYMKMNHLKATRELVFYEGLCELDNYEAMLTHLMNRNQNAQHQLIRFLNDNTKLRSKLSAYLKDL
jgi:hypothetical protein